MKAIATAPGQPTQYVELSAEEKIKRTAEEQAHESARPHQELLKQMSELEALQTPRRMREAMLGTDAGWMETLEDQITALRVQL